MTAIYTFSRKAVIASPMPLVGRYSSFSGHRLQGDKRYIIYHSILTIPNKLARNPQGRNIKNNKKDSESHIYTIGRKAESHI